MAGFLTGLVAKHKSEAGEVPVEAPLDKKSTGRFAMVTEAIQKAETVEKGLTPTADPIIVETPSEPEQIEVEQAKASRFTISGTGRTQLASDEGHRNKVYKDSEGILTIGVGFNLEAEHNVKLFNKLLPGVDFNKVKSGEISLTDEQSNILLDSTIDLAEDDVRDLVPDFDVLPQNVQDALINMSFNLGKTRLAGFEKMLAAIQARDGAEAQKQALASKWAKQVKGRATRLAREFASLKPHRAETIE